MRHRLKDSFKNITAQILEEHKTLEEWAAIEADDMFQQDDYEGGAMLVISDTSPISNLIMVDHLHQLITKARFFIRQELYDRVLILAGEG